MRTTRKLTVTVAHATARAAQAHADQQGLSLSAVMTRALCDYLRNQALRTEPGTDPDWVQATTETATRQQAA